MLPPGAYGFPGNRHHQYRFRWLGSNVQGASPAGECKTRPPVQAQSATGLTARLISLWNPRPACYQGIFSPWKSKKRPLSSGLSPSITLIRPFTLCSVV